VVVSSGRAEKRRCGREETDHVEDIVEACEPLALIGVETGNGKDTGAIYKQVSQLFTLTLKSWLLGKALNTHKQ
jgi:hypothetical protein